MPRAADRPLKQRPGGLGGVGVDVATNPIFDVVIERGVDRVVVCDAGVAEVLVGVDGRCAVMNFGLEESMQGGRVTPNRPAPLLTTGVGGPRDAPYSLIQSWAGRMEDLRLSSNASYAVARSSTYGMSCRSAWHASARVKFDGCSGLGRKAWRGRETRESAFPD